MDEELPEFAIIIEKLNQELEEERTKYENKILVLQNEIKILEKKYNPGKSINKLLYDSIRSVNHFNIAKLVHKLNGNSFRCLSLKNKSWEYFNNGEWKPMEQEIFVKKAINDSKIIYENKYQQVIELLTHGDPESAEFSQYIYLDENFPKIFKSFDSPKFLSFVLRELRELFYISPN